MKLFTNASLPTASAALKRVNVLFEEKILKISADEIPCEETPEVIDLKGKILLPGAIDTHSHILSPGDPAKSIGRISKAALCGGWTTLCELSYLNPMPVFEVNDLKALEGVINRVSYTDMGVWGNVDIGNYPYHAEDAQALWANGVVGIALMSPSPNEAIIGLDFTEIMDLFIDIYESDTAFAFQGYDQENGKPCSFDTQREAIKKILRRMQENPIHIPRVCSFATIEFINSISKRSDISFGMCIADLMKLFSGIESGLKQELEENKDALFELLRTNKIYLLSNNVSSTHAHKGLEEVFQGTSEQLLPYSYLWLLSELWKQRKIPLATVIKMSSENPAKRLGLYPVKGCLEAGSDADFVVYNPEGSTSFAAPDGSNHELQGSIETVWLRGRKACAKGKAAAAGGSFLPRHTNPKRRYNNTTWI